MPCSATFISSGEIPPPWGVPDDEAAVRLLLRHPNLEIDKKHGVSNALIWAVVKGNMTLVKLLVSHGANVNTNYSSTGPELELRQSGRKYVHHIKYNYNALFYARHWKHEAIERYLKQQGAKYIPRTETYFDWD